MRPYPLRATCVNARRSPVNRIGHPRLLSSWAVTKKILSRYAASVARRDWTQLHMRGAETIVFSHPDYIGVTQSARTLFRDWYPLRESDLSTPLRIPALVEALRDAKVRTLVFSGFAAGYDRVITSIRKRLPSIRILVLWHGSVLQNAEDCNWNHLTRIIQLARAGQVDRVGFFKAGMAELIARTGIATAFVMNYVKHIPEGASRPEADGRIHLGLWTPGRAWRKNPFAMISAAALVEDAALSGILDSRAIAWCELLGVSLDRVYSRPLDHSQLMEFLPLMHCNLYVTLSECSPLFPLESLSAGVPCLVSPTSHLFEDAEFLRARLVVERIDNPQQIAEQIREVTAERGEIIDAYRAYAFEYNRVAEHAIAAFLHA